MNIDEVVTDLYNVSYTRPDTGDTSIGTVRSFYDTKEEKATIDRGNLIVDDCVLPMSFEIPRDKLVSVDFKTADAFIQDAHDKARKKAPKSDFSPGAIFSLPGADGAAFYVVTEIKGSSCTVEWRGFGGGDRYTDHWLKWGGKFPIPKIKPHVRRGQLFTDMKLFHR